MHLAFPSTLFRLEAIWRKLRASFSQEEWGFRILTVVIAVGLGCGNLTLMRVSYFLGQVDQYQVLCNGLAPAAAAPMKKADASLAGAASASVRVEISCRGRP
ncbi:hypothetical protein ACFJIX_24960 [Roseateles sp. UC29_93]|uniref:hypothetical protein n=1 Tax=Roseateles sp. UC29_93 TaxID=3350177 RepID=UPI00366B8853